VNADTDRRLWASGAFTTRIESLAWSADGRRLLVLTRSFFVMLDGRGNAIAKGATGGRAEAAAFAPGDSRIALVRTIPNRKAGRSEVVLLEGDGSGERRLFEGPGSFTEVTWSPDGEWLQLGWRDADQWLFIRPRDERIKAVSSISRQFHPGETGDRPFPRVSGWCCPG
jgi:dipeptidyl aminopeptidase/acylaminoacyl peptidase